MVTFPFSGGIVDERGAVLYNCCNKSEAIEWNGHTAAAATP